MKRVLEVMYFGYGILVFAAIINWFGIYFGLKSWYDLFGVINFHDLRLVNVIWLIVVYPFLLGISIYLLNKHKEKIIKF